ncbi:2773_t:CDS:10, partial [Paraglomus occultum]
MTNCRPRSLLHTLLFLIVFLACSSNIASFYLPGVAPTDYKKNSTVELLVNSLTPGILPQTQQLKSVIPYDYYNDKFHFCKPADLSMQSESLGSILFGDRIFKSRFELNMQIPVDCKILCDDVVTIPPADAKFINARIRENYVINWLIDGLPAATNLIDGKKFYSGVGFGLGQVTSSGIPHFNNHYKIIVKVHKQEDKYRVVGVFVDPSSRNYSAAVTEKTACAKTWDPLVLDENKANKVIFTYTVEWQSESQIQWATRWDSYLHVFDPKIHWFSLVNSIVIVLFLTGMVAMILLRALHKDITRYNQLDSQACFGLTETKKRREGKKKEDVQEDFGWKLVHGDVFRPPSNVMLLSVLLGNGIQLFCMTAVTLVFAVLGFLSPSNRGSLATVMIIFYMLFASVSGYVSARVYKMFAGKSWNKNIIMTATLLPVLIFSILFTINFFLVGANSSGAVPATTMIGTIVLWFLISVPLSCIGSYIGFKKPAIEHPVRTNPIPRQIPDQVFYLRPIPSMLMGGVLPFGAIFIELYFIMSSIWGNKIYYLFGIASLVFVILTITCSEVTILLCYFHLCAEDYHWSWRAFLTSGASGLYIFLYSIMYYTTKLHITSFTSTVVYFGWTSLMSLLFFILTGAIGYFACLVFVRKIFASIKPPERAVSTDADIERSQQVIIQRSGHRYKVLSYSPYSLR